MPVDKFTLPGSTTGQIFFEPVKFNLELANLTEEFLLQLFLGFGSIDFLAVKDRD